MATACVILNFNDYENTFALIQKISNYQVFDHIVVVDNCSTDDSPDKLLKHRNEKIHIIKSERNGGYGYGNNFGISFAYNKLQSRYILIANPDVEFEEVFIKELKNTISSNSNCAVVSGIPLTIDGKPQDIIGWSVPKGYQYMLTASGTISRYLLMNRMFYGIKYFTKKKSLKTIEVGCVAGALLLIDANIIYNNAMYDEEIFLYGEETILGLKLRELGFKTLIRTDQRYIHKHSATINKTFSSSLKKHKIMLDSHRTILSKYYKYRGLKFVLVDSFFKLTIAEVGLKQLIRRILKVR
ncbi:glycosyltransferase family 2 protein [Cytobacillus gottheilii]|uniref:glycosyltransferase family 2 protein n=1 Tax=Cytobacillus gottheilii TaxID=859144 RepID=UPI0008318D60|nr:glycosyltransferase [Cytobacillus gottheilii]